MYIIVALCFLVFSVFVFFRGEIKAKSLGMTSCLRCAIKDNCDLRKQESTKWNKVAGCANGVKK